MKLLFPIVFITAISACKVSTESTYKSESDEFSNQDSDSKNAIRYVHARDP
ncbi:MAG: hypothetical protein WCI18_10245 [Pseudomonadota bacterium]